MIGPKVHAPSRAEEEQKQTSEPKKFQQPMGVSIVTERLKSRKVATFKIVQVMKFFIVFYHAVKHFNCLFVDISLTYMIGVTNISIFSTLQFLI